MRIKINYSTELNNYLLGLSVKKNYKIEQITKINMFPIGLKTFLMNMQHKYCRQIFIAVCYEKASRHLLRQLEAIH